MPVKCVEGQNKSQFLKTWSFFYQIFFLHFFIFFHFSHFLFSFSFICHIHHCLTVQGQICNYWEWEDYCIIQKCFRIFLELYCTALHWGFPPIMPTLPRHWLKYFLWGLRGSALVAQSQSSNSPKRKQAGFQNNLLRVYKKVCSSNSSVSVDYCWEKQPSPRTW